MKKIVTTLILAIILTSCGTSSLVTNAQKLELGMTKQEVISTIGNNFRIVSAVQTPEGNIEVLRYEQSKLTGDRIEKDVYMMRFLDGKLVEWYEERPHPQH